MRRLLPLFCGLLLVGACQTEPVERMEAPATEAEKDQAVQWFIDCVKAASARLDDRISDAMTIATVIISDRCAPQAEQAAEVFARGENYRVKAMVRDQFLHGGAQELAAKIVLDQRARRSAL